METAKKEKILIKSQAHANKQEETMGRQRRSYGKMWQAGLEFK